MFLDCSRVVTVTDREDLKERNTQRCPMLQKNQNLIKKENSGLNNCVYTEMGNVHCG